MVKPKKIINFTCQKCGKTVKLEKWRVQKSRKYCSKKCYLESVGEQKEKNELKKKVKKKKVKKKKQPKEKKIEKVVEKKRKQEFKKTCLVCKFDFLTMKENQKFCSRECNQKYQSTKNKTKNKNLAKAFPIIKISTITEWNIEIYCNKKFQEECQHQGTINGVMKRIAKFFREEKPANLKTIDIHIRFLREVEL